MRKYIRFPYIEGETPEQHRRRRENFYRKEKRFLKRSANPTPSAARYKYPLIEGESAADREKRIRKASRAKWRAIPAVKKKLSKKAKERRENNPGWIIRNEKRLARRAAKLAQKRPAKPKVEKPKQERIIREGGRTIHRLLDD